jgi:hypothetical protein
MSVELRDIEVGSVVVDCRGAIGIVTEITNRPAWPITYAVKASGSLYKGKPELFKAIIGKVDINAFKAASEAPVVSQVFGGSDPSFLMPEPLRSMGLKIGDKIKVKHGFDVVEAIFDGFKPSRPKYPISYTMNGRRWKGTTYAIVGKAA